MADAGDLLGGHRRRRDVDRFVKARNLGIALRRTCGALLVAAGFPGLLEVAEAKRGAPAAVAAVRVGDIEYRAPHLFRGEMFPGFVEAYDHARGGPVWLRQIYVIRRDPSLEGDLQDVCITQLKHLPDRDVLEVTHEAGSRFELDLETLDVKTVAGKGLLGI